MLHMGSYLISQMHFFEVAKMRSFKAIFEKHECAKRSRSKARKSLSQGGCKEGAAIRSNLFGQWSF